MDNARIATLAQLLLAHLPEARASLVEPTCYRALPDFEELHSIEHTYVPGSPPPNPPAGSWLGFVFSKPTIVDGKVQVHVFEPSAVDGPRADELWIKLKRAEVILSLAPEAAPVDNPAAIVNRAILDWAKQQVKEPVNAIVCETDAPVADGPTWLRTHMDIIRSGDRITVRSPMTQTPIDSLPRFAGMHYMKVISPSWALRTLRGE